MHRLPWKYRIGHIIVVAHSDGRKVDWDLVPQALSVLMELLLRGSFVSHL